ncbi:hypothetical protein CPAST_c22450 [Clostridium pasteurianum DSM 525 = ATCC 6013]|uniref:DUF2513 domain-containing protein n=1 Tax=Clostridium pasteurianum DSM 525 = ATCC 6013 TaxID=1262449 RepID=A0A0H3JA75_CLOPA|nr:DUF2513 domain-containing protein [Clostridium pasteurianum]AJA48315.1 hypothetical protein CPAST_c22450 [Clostridium pasteurianum DSM 525 = ATCC 6013]AJA52303.1 hypothetical protein CLPA_c22450 [Clostridium pasteurianum DSM 525 = ATCC 6013]AOZ75567.1 hypothetical protein AQ983_10905 [Clostridium pasteurianum DSM 525 = ATCC 6013]AOZ79362.1 hypothetical protein AQ984_10895 [Clostridium pasteurianum]ELP60535.1 hypothetical protein F502_03582 [Clostridium pasteurianum DSM 525 = ATCC 6013]
MRLNNDCIRDILLYVEKNTTYEYPFIAAEDLISHLKDYDEDTVNYHITKVHQGGLIDVINYRNKVPLDVSFLSWKGHEYIDAIRDDKVWEKLKNSTKDIASVSLAILVRLAEDVIKSLLIEEEQ